jgi:hypothetical protein
MTCGSPSTTGAPYWNVARPLSAQVISNSGGTLHALDPETLAELPASLERTGNTEGYRMDLATLWRLAAGWYAGRLERGYRRREPAQARAYFADVGLSGPFWGLP